MPRLSKGLRQAYELQDCTYEALLSLRDALRGPIVGDKDGKLAITREDAQSIAALVKSWEACQQRIQVHRRVPNPGSLKHAVKEPKPKSWREMPPWPVPLGSPRDPGGTPAG